MNDKLNPAKKLLFENKIITKINIELKWKMQTACHQLRSSYARLKLLLYIRVFRTILKLLFIITSTQ